MSLPCLCQGTTARIGESHDSAHAVWVAFLAVENNHYDRETWGLDYMCLPTNWLTSFLSGSPFFHVQLFFWDAAARTSRTYSVDASRKCVFTEGMKDFGSIGWTFVRLDVSMEQELAMCAFLQSQLGAPFSSRAYGIFCVPSFVYDVCALPCLNRARTHTSWFCSELVTAACQQAGMLRSLDAGSSSPGSLYRALFLEPATIRASFAPLHALAEQRRHVSMVETLGAAAADDASQATARRTLVMSAKQ